jgi:hypothetical protein
MTLKKSFNREDLAATRREKTIEERRFDNMIATGIRGLNGTNPIPLRGPTSNLLVLRADRYGRKGQTCRVLRQRGAMVHVRFDDGFEAIVQRKFLRRPKEEPCSSSPSSSSLPT